MTSAGYCRAMAEKSTTPDLVELVRSFAESAPNDLDVFLEFFADDAVWEAVPLGISYHGVGEIRAFLTEWMGTYDEYEIEPREIRDLGNGVVLAVVHQLTRLAGSTTRTRMTEPWAFVVVWVEGSVARAAAYQNIDEARAAAERLAEERG